MAKNFKPVSFIGKPVSKQSFKILKPGKRFHLGNRTIILDEKLNADDAKLIAEQYPGSIEFNVESVNVITNDSEGNTAEL